MGFRFSGHGSGGTQAPHQGMIAELRTYWEALRVGNALPRRDRVDPRGIAGALEHSFLIERIGPGLARFRIAGMAFNDLMGMDIRGMPISALFVGEARQTLQLSLERVFNAPAIATLNLTAEHGMGRPLMSARMILLPMLGQQGVSDLAIGCIEIAGEIGRTPRRFAIREALHEVVAHTPPAAAQPGAVPVMHPHPLSKVVVAQTFLTAQSGQTGQTTQTAAPLRPAGVPYLRLVKG